MTTTPTEGRGGGGWMGAFPKASFQAATQYVSRLGLAGKDRIAKRCRHCLNCDFASQSRLAMQH